MLLALRNGMRVKRFDFYGYGMTTLELSGPGLDLEIKLVSRHGVRERRALIRGFFQQLKPFLDLFERVAVDHSPDGVIRRKRSYDRALRPVQGSSLESKRGAFGFEVRLKRLKLGISQEELADELGIQRSHLSDIERGLYFPRSKLRARLEAVLSGLEPDNRPGKLG